MRRLRSILGGVRRAHALWTVGALATFALLVSGGVLVATVQEADIRSWWLVAAAVMALAIATGSVALFHRFYSQEAQRQQLALVSIRPLLGKLPVPVMPEGWWVDPVFSQLLVQLLVELRPKVVLECGSGSSTVLLAACLEEMQQGLVVSLEEDPPWAIRTERLLRERGLEHRARVIPAPLGPVSQGDLKVRDWYTLPEDSDWLPGPVDLLVVDGPSTARHPEARLPAVAVLRPHLHAQTVIVMDDGKRPGERRVARSWGRDLRVTPVYKREGKGSWILSLTPRRLPI